MAVYSVFQPPHTSESAARPEQFRFVRDGFSWGAFLFGPLWMIARRLWLALVLYVAVVALLSAGMGLAGVPVGAQVAVAALVALLLGLEGATLHRWTLCRRRWRDLGIVVADDVEAAERRFFDGWVAGLGGARQSDTTTAHPPWPLPAKAPVANSGPDVIGLFPEPGPKP